MTVGCAPCEEGTYSPLGIYCLTCPAGSYTADQINCNPCDAGKYSATDGATSCTACPPGRHQPASGQTECEICEPGRVASASGQATCDQCDAGTYSAAAGASTCVDCAPGWIQPESGRSECEQCAAGRFASSATACSGCRQFGEGRWSPPGAAACDICDRDYYYDGQSCLDCPWSATCARNSTLGSQWIVDEGFYRFSMDTPEIYRCKRNDGCVKVDTHDEQTPEELTKRLGAHDKGRFMLQRSNVVTSRHLVERESKARKSGGWRLMRFISKRRGRRETVHPDQPPKAPPVRRAVQDEEEDDSDSYPISYP